MPNFFFSLGLSFLTCRVRALTSGYLLMQGLAHGNVPNRGHLASEFSLKPLSCHWCRNRCHCPPGDSLRLEESSDFSCCVVLSINSKPPLTAHLRYFILVILCSFSGKNVFGRPGPMVGGGTQVTPGRPLSPGFQLAFGAHDTPKARDPLGASCFAQG